MIEFVPFRPEHLAGLELQAAQRYLEAAMEDAELSRAIALPGLAYTGFAGDRVVGAAGVLPLWPGRAQGWALIGEAMPRRAWPRVTRRTLAVLDAAHARGYRRIETTVLPGFGPGHRWAAALGFLREGLLRAYGSDGQDYVLYARVR